MKFEYFSLLRAHPVFFETPLESQGVPDFFQGFPSENTFLGVFGLALMSLEAVDRFDETSMISYYLYRAW